MDAQLVFEQMLALFQFEPTNDQREAFWTLARFVTADVERGALILKGAAGTGKTTMLRALVDTLMVIDVPVILLAPTGRAAKVISSKVDQAAFTIHKHIYSASTSDEGAISFKRRPNDDLENAVYIVDEASMLSDERGSEPFSTHSGLLDDLIRFVYEGCPQNRLLLIGDPVQLPPVGLETSPGLEAPFLKTRFDLKIKAIEIKEVKRQALKSGILDSATRLREVFQAPAPVILPQFARRKDVQILESSREVVELFAELYDPTDLAKVVVITLSNATAVKINQAVRNNLLSDPEPLESGDLVMVVRNYYQDFRSDMPFIANGEMGVARKVSLNSRENLYNIDWCDADIEFRDLNDQPYEISAKIPLSLFDMKEPAMTRDQNMLVWQERKAEQAQGKSRQKLKKNDLKKDPYVGCLQLKYGYAITAHKAQGGQWENVIVVFEPYHTQRMMETEPKGFLRWAYTAITRAQKNVYLLNSPFDIELNR